MTYAEAVGIAMVLANLAVLILMGYKLWWAPIIGVLHEPLWFLHSWWLRDWPILVLSIAYTIIYTATGWKWYRERKPKWSGKLPRTPSC